MTAMAAAAAPQPSAPQPSARKALVLGDRTNTDPGFSPVLSPVLSPVPASSGCAAARRAAEAASTPQPSYSCRAAHQLEEDDAEEDAPWKESWTDEVFSADIAVPSGFDLASLTGPGGARTERVEVDTGTVITVEPTGMDAMNGSGGGGGGGGGGGSCGGGGGRDSPGSMSIVICGNDERNVDEARARIEDFLSASQLDESSLLQDDADTVAALSSKLFEVELQLLQQEEEQSQRYVPCVPEACSGSPHSARYAEGARACLSRSQAGGRTAGAGAAHRAIDPAGRAGRRAAGCAADG